MTTLSSSSTTAQWVAEWEDTASYAASNSVALARRHAIASRVLSGRKSLSVSGGGVARTRGVDYTAAAQAAEAYAKARATTIKRLGHRDMRRV